MTETELFRAYGRRERRQCACQGYLEADPCRPDDVEQAVVEHQQTEKHTEWRWLNGIETMIRRVE